MKPGYGNEFLLVQLSIKNGYSYAQENSVAVVGVCDGQRVDVSSTALLECDPLLSYEPDSPNEEAVGEVGFEVPKNWREFILYYLPTDNVDDAIIFVITR